MYLKIRSKPEIFRVPEPANPRVKTKNRTRNPKTADTRPEPDPLPSIDRNETAARVVHALDVGGRTNLDKVKARSGLWRSLSACLEAEHAAPTEARRGSKGTAQRSCTE